MAFSSNQKMMRPQLTSALLWVFQLGTLNLQDDPVLQSDVCFDPSTQQKFDSFNKAPLLYKKRS
ncbi:hypothetical protein DR106_26425 [Escherichia coli]|nr:hypothetical protein DR106_26425 [Escherichia coli]